MQRHKLRVGLRLLRKDGGAVNCPEQRHVHVILYVERAKAVEAVHIAERLFAQGLAGLRIPRGCVGTVPILGSCPCLA